MSILQANQQLWGSHACTVTCDVPSFVSDPVWKIVDFKCFPISNLRWDKSERFDRPTNCNIRIDVSDNSCGMLYGLFHGDRTISNCLCFFLWNLQLCLDIHGQMIGLKGHKLEPSYGHHFLTVFSGFDVCFTMVGPESPWLHWLNITTSSAIWATAIDADCFMYESNAPGGYPTWQATARWRDNPSHFEMVYLLGMGPHLQASYGHHSQSITISI